MVDTSPFRGGKMQRKALAPLKEETGVKRLRG